MEAAAGRQKIDGRLGFSYVPRSRTQSGVKYRYYLLMVWPVTFFHRDICDVEASSGSYSKAVSLPSL